MPEQPYLSIVVTARNDDHGGHLLERMQAFMDALFAQSARAEMPCELIIVEWNPPVDRPRLAQVLNWPAGHARMTVRIIEVPPALHQTYRHAASLPLYQMIAKNVGIRRARGRFVLATNIDIILSQELFDHLAAMDLDPDRMYRVDRHDVAGDFPWQAPLPQMLAFCREHIIRLNERAGTLSHLTGEYNWVYPPRDDAFYRHHAVRAPLHTNTCGDFTLLGREHWFDLKGYAEFDAYSFHIDSILCFQAHFGGAPELLLSPPLVAYHIEHDAGYGPEKSKEGALRSSLAQRGIPIISNTQFDNLAAKMTEDEKPYLFNDDSWGLEGRDLPEHQPLRAAWDRAPAHGAKASRSSAEECYLSLVAAGRNDDHGGDFLARSQSCLDVLAAQCQKHQLSAELILVDWNTPAGKPPLGRALQTPPPGHPLQVRFIEVPPDLHQSMGNHHKIPFFQMAAKNVGLRRARGRFALAFNMDLVLSDELVAFLARQELDPDVSYRVDRYDLSQRLLPPGLNLDQLMRFCQEHVARVHRKEQRPLHTNACGDFTLLSLRRWLQIGGYPELPYYSLYTDAVLLYMAHVLGVREQVLADPHRVYHLEHGKSWSVEPQVAQSMPTLDFQRDMVPWYQRMLSLGRPLNPNGKDWGLAGHELSETEPVSAGAKEAPVPRKGKKKQKKAKRAGQAARPQAAPQVVARPAQPAKPRPFTIFAVPKPMAGPMAVIQRNAIQSWLHLDPQPEVILLGDDKGVAQLARELGLIHVPHLERNEQGTPLVSDIFAQAQARASHGVLAYVNADIILTSDFTPALAQVEAKFERFLLIGQRWDLDLERPINFGAAQWEDALRESVGQMGSLHEVTGIDYFVFTKGLYEEIPPFALGRVAWDNWLVWKPLEDGHAVVDATEVILAVHQNHDYGHVEGGKTEVWHGPEARANRELAGSRVLIGVTSSATWELTRLGFMPKPRPTAKPSAEQIGSLAVAEGNQGLKLLEEGRLKEALERLDAADRMCVGFAMPGLQFTRAKVLLGLERQKQAVAALEKELSWHPQHQEARNLLALLQGQDAAQDAASLGEGARRKEEASRLGMTLFSQGRLEEAKDAFLALLKEEPDNPQAHNNLALIHWQQGLREQAVEELAKLARRAPHYRDAAWNLGQLLAMLGRAQEAKQVYREFVSRHPEETEMVQVLSGKVAKPEPPRPQGAAS